MVFVFVWPFFWALMKHLKRSFKLRYDRIDDYLEEVKSTNRKIYWQLLAGSIDELSFWKHLFFRNRCSLIEAISSRMELFLSLVVSKKSDDFSICSCRNRCSLFNLLIVLFMASIYQCVISSPLRQSISFCPHREHARGLINY